MRTIYSKAWQTLVWLGKEDESFNDAKRCIELLRAKFHDAVLIADGYPKVSTNTLWKLPKHYRLFIDKSA